MSLLTLFLWLALAVVDFVGGGQVVVAVVGVAGGLLVVWVSLLMIALVAANDGCSRER